MLYCTVYSFSAFNAVYHNLLYLFIFVSLRMLELVEIIDDAWRWDISEYLNMTSANNIEEWYY